MTVGFVFNDGEKRIVGGAESHYPTDDLAWLDFMGKEIMIQTAKGGLFFIVKIIDIRSHKHWLNIGC